MSQDLSEVRLTRAVVRKAVVNRAALSPASLGSAGIGLLLAAGGLALQFGPVVSIAGLLLIPAGFLASYRFRYAEYSKRFVQAVDDAIERNRKRREGEIRADLYDIANTLPAKDESGDLAAEALTQFGRIHDKFELFLDVLNRKLQTSELAYARFHGIANDFFMTVMEHLNRTGDALKLASQSDADDVREQQLASVRDMLEQNAAALEAFDRSSASIAAMRDKDALESEDLAFVRTQLEELDRQARRLAEI
ncbi:MAG: hypothetical protein QNI99_01085 [Woeseiaceae bacterium]|nr:hypothetical protein [Woeseiaceae bacterium]